MPPKYGFDLVKIFKSRRTTEENVNKIKSWLNESDFPKLTDEQIVLFLLACNNNIDVTQTTIKANFDCKKKNPRFFENRNMETEILKQAASVQETSVMPVRTKDNHAVILIRLKDTSFYNFNLENNIKILFMCAELILFKNPPNGLVVICDFRGVAVMHLTKFRIGPVKQFFRYFQETFPCQLKAIHVLHSVYIFNKVLSLCKPIMSDTTYNLIHIHTTDLDMEEFYRNCVSKDCMPQDYGGELADQATLSRRSYQLLRELEEFFAEEEMQRKQHVVKR